MLRPADHWTDIAANWIVMILIVLPLVAGLAASLIAVMMWVLGVFT